MSESQSVNEEDFGEPGFDNEDMGYATPGHVEEQDFMTAFFENQDHDAFADKAEDDSYGGDSEMDNYLNDFFGSHNGATAVEEGASDDDGMEEYLSNFGPNDNEDADEETFDEGAEVNEEDNEDDLTDFLDDFKADEQNKPWEPTVYKETDDGAAGYVSDFFNNDPETTSQNNPFDEGAVVNEDDNFADFLDDFKADTQNRPNEGYRSYPEFSEETDQEITSQDEPVDDLELWLQAMEDHEEEVEEEDAEEGKSLLDPDFSNNFPPDDMFTFVMVQEMAKECQDWQKKAKEVQTEVNHQGQIIREKIQKLDEDIKKFEQEGKDEKTQCDLQCEKVCVPVNVGDECVEEVNGTCILTQPKIDDCGQRITDPKCEAAENECKSKRKATADKVKKTNEEKDAEKQKLDALTDKLKKVMEEFPPKCDQGTPAQSASNH